MKFDRTVISDFELVDDGPENIDTLCVDCKNITEHDVVARKVLHEVKKIADLNQYYRHDIQEWARDIEGWKWIHKSEEGFFILKCKGCKNLKFYSKKYHKDKMGGDNIKCDEPNSYPKGNVVNTEIQGPIEIENVYKDKEVHLPKPARREYFESLEAFKNKIWSVSVCGVKRTMVEIARDMNDGLSNDDEVVKVLSNNLSNVGIGYLKRVWNYCHTVSAGTRRAHPRNVENVFKGINKIITSAYESIPRIPEDEPENFERLEELFDSSIVELIDKGESEYIEFKAQIGNSKDNLNGEVSAFMNSKGGILIIGVADNGYVKGIEEEFETEDQARKKVQDKLESDIHSVTLNNNTSLECLTVNDEKVLKVECRPSEELIFVEGEGNSVKFFVRSDNKKKPLKSTQINQYIEKKSPLVSGYYTRR